MVKGAFLYSKFCHHGATGAARKAMKRIQDAGIAAGWTAWQGQWEEAARQKRMLAGAAARLALACLRSSAPELCCVGHSIVRPASIWIARPSGQRVDRDHTVSSSTSCPQRSLRCRSSTKLVLLVALPACLPFQGSACPPAQRRHQSPAPACHTRKCGEETQQ